MSPLKSSKVHAGENTPLVRFWEILSSLRLFLVLAFGVVVAMVLGTLIPQQDLTTSPEMSTNLYHSGWFIGLLALLACNTTACVVTRVLAKNHRALPWGAIFSHVGVVVVLLGGVVGGLWGVKGVLPLEEGRSAHQIYSKGRWIPLPFQVVLKNFSIDWYEPSRQIMKVTHRAQGWTETLEVTPGQTYHARGFPITVLQYLPDFVLDDQGRAGTRSGRPRNPAVLVQVAASPPVRSWLFAKYPGGGHSSSLADPLLEYGYIEGKIKQFRSRLVILKGERPVIEGVAEVNRPLTFEGYTLYQSGYDADNPKASTLQVAKDPGVPMVYAGFGCLSLGLIWSFLKQGSGDNGGTPHGMDS